MEASGAARARGGGAAAVCCFPASAERALGNASESLASAWLPQPAASAVCGVKVKVLEFCLLVVYVELKSKQIYRSVGVFAPIVILKFLYEV